MLHLEVAETALDIVTALYKASKGKNLRLLIEVVEPPNYGAELPGQWVKDAEDTMGD